MADDLQSRLKETYEACDKAYAAWSDDQKSVPAQETLGEAVHELRKVASRLEIELAVCESQRVRSFRSNDDQGDFGHDDGQKNTGSKGRGRGGRRPRTANGNGGAGKKSADAGA